MVFLAAVKRGNFWLDQAHPDCACKKYAALYDKAAAYFGKSYRAGTAGKGPRV